MDDLTTLARQLVEAGAFRWETGMLVHSDANAWDPMWNPGRLCRVEDREPDDIPILADPATAALLAVQAMERGAEFYHFADGWRVLLPFLDGTGICPTLGEAAARALLALAQSTTKETT
jgi:hypothetical protein